MPQSTRAKGAGGGRTLTQDERDVLQNYIDVQNNQAHITRKLDEALYQRIKQAFEHLGGIYVPGRKCFEFCVDPSPLIAQTVTLGQMPKENPLDFYYSPPGVVDDVLARLEHGNTMHDLVWDYEHAGRPIRVLEPSAGLGHLADTFRERYPMAVIEVCEVDPYRQAVLQAKGYCVVAEDFLQYAPPPDRFYDVILMNPPFTIDGDVLTFIKHITHAEQMLSESPWSKLVSVVPAQCARVERYQQFYIHVLQYGDYEALQQGAFVEAGTKWETGIISLSRQLKHFYATWDHADSEDGYPNERIHHAWMYISSFDEPLSTAHASLLRDMVEGRCVVYSNGCAAPETKTRIQNFCQQVTQRLLYEYQLYIPFSPQDEEAMQRYILRDYRQACREYSGVKRAEWERNRRREHDAMRSCIDKAEATLQSYQRWVATQEKVLAKYRSELETFERTAASCPSFLPAAQPPPPEAQRESAPGALPSPPLKRPHPTTIPTPIPRGGKTPFRRYRQLAFF